MNEENSQVLAQLDELLNRPRQMWLLGAGISKNAGVPLMYPLTDRIGEVLDDDWKDDFNALREALDKSAHVEHILTHLGNLIEIAENRRDRRVTFAGRDRSTGELRGLHSAIQQQLRGVIRWGYWPAEKEEDEVVGTRDEPATSIENHVEFVEALFNSRRAGLEQRPPVALFTTNYDTLLEDALALRKIAAFDGFRGGAMGFWSTSAPEYAFLEPFSNSRLVDAKLYKLHGSIDWYSTTEEIVVRRREGSGYPPEKKSRLLVYPQATKYLTTQVEPFSHLFRAFRNGLMSGSEGVLGVCGYGFGDRHINEEILRAFQHPDNKLTLVAFVKEENDNEEEEGPGKELPLPGPLENWLCGSQGWRERLLVVSNRGIYHAGPENRWQGGEERGLNLWTFEGLTSFLHRGPEAVGVDHV